MLDSYGHSLSLAKTQRRKERRMFFCIALTGGCRILLGIRYPSQRRKDAILGSVQLNVSVLFSNPSFVLPCGGLHGGRRPEGRPPQGMVLILR